MNSQTPTPTTTSASPTEPLQPLPGTGPSRAPHRIPVGPARPARGCRPALTPAPAAAYRPALPARRHPLRPATDFFTWIRSHGIQRGRDRWIGGVSSGIAHRMGIDPLIVRGIFIVLTLFAGVGVLLYGIAWAFLPSPTGASTSRKPARADGPAA